MPCRLSKIHSFTPLLIHSFFIRTLGPPPNHHSFTHLLIHSLTTLDRTLAPPIQPLARVTLPDAAVSTLPGGARLHVLHNAAQPVVRLQAVFRAGKLAETKPGLALLTARMLLEGTATRTARQIADEVAFYGASLECEAGLDRATLTLYCLTRHLPALLPLVQDVLANPAFPAAELAQLQTRTLQNVQVERQKTAHLATECFNEALFGAENPYGRPFDDAAFEALTADDAHAFHAVSYLVKGAELFLSGDVAGLEPAVAAVFSRLPDAGNARPAAPAAKSAAPNVPGTVLRVPLAGSLQASLRIGRHWPALGSPDTHRLNLLVKVLGGYFGSRLMRNIREDKGLTYGIYASVAPRERGTTLVIGTDVKGDQADFALAEIQNELRRLQEEPIPEDELHTVKSYVLGKFANELSTVFEQSDKYKTLIMLGLPADYYTTFVQQIESATAEELQALAQEYLSPESLQVVIAGPEGKQGR